jgi:hypothetical protein
VNDERFNPMRNARPKNRRWIEAAADDLDFDYFADQTGLAGDLPMENFGGGAVELNDQESELIEAELLSHEVCDVAGNPAEAAAVIKLQVGEINAVRGWAA